MAGKKSSVERMRTSGWPLMLVLLGGCQPPASPVSAPDLVEPAVFSTWASATEKPVQIGPDLWADCRAPTPEEAKALDAKLHGLHAGYSIVVRVSPDAIAAFRDGKPLPVGAVVVKEKYADRLASGPLQGYAVMAKQTAGFDLDGGDWEYAFVTLVPDRAVTRGRLAECAGCHASARGTDYLFRSYGRADK